MKNASAQTIASIVRWLELTCPGSELFSDSREIGTSTRHAVFFAYEGDSADGRNYISKAIENGAIAVVYESEGFTWNPEWNVPHRGVSGLKAYAGPIADAYYGSPAKSMLVIAVTGTNGKTSCTQWIGQSLSRWGKKTAVIGTLGVSVFEDGKSGIAEETGYTTPDQVQLQRKLAELRKKGVACIAMEASSIGIDQGRLNGIPIDIALFTNFTRDHLDYHHDMAAYKAAKRKLFNWPGLKYAVLNLDDPMGIELTAGLAEKIALIGFTLENADAGIPVLRAQDLRNRIQGIEFRVESPFGAARVRTHLIGRFNVSNTLGVLGVLLAAGMPWDKAVFSLGELLPPPGRMQQMGSSETPLVVIDFAHTPDAMEKGLSALRQVADDRNGRLWCVFGCGGDRDHGKRPQMGAVSEQADFVIVTSDNPRSEDPKEIMKQIVSGMQKSPQMFEDRATAILQAVRQASKNDVIFLAGKGHETYQEIKGVKLPFADADHVALALASRVSNMKVAV